MKLLISGWNSWGVLDTESGAYEPRGEGEGPYYGITFDKDRIYVVAHAGGNRPHVQVYDAKLVGLEGIYPTVALDDTHQAVVHEGTLYITCAGRNRVALYDFNTRLWDVWYPDAVRDIDHNHFNSIFFASDGMLHLLAHNQPGRVAENPVRQSEVWLFTKTRSRIATDPIKVGFGAHCVWRHPPTQTLFVLDSQGGRISGVSDAAAPPVQVHVGGYLRGVVMTSERCFVGSMPHASVRGERDKLTSHVHVFNKAWECLAKIPVHDLGPICEIRAPGVNDWCHLHEKGPAIP